MEGLVLADEEHKPLKRHRWISSALLLPGFQHLTNIKSFLRLQEQPKEISSLFFSTFPFLSFSSPPPGLNKGGRCIVYELARTKGEKYN